MRQGILTEGMIRVDAFIYVHMGIEQPTAVGAGVPSPPGSAAVRAVDASHLVTHCPCSENGFINKICYQPVDKDVNKSSAQQ